MTDEYAEKQIVDLIIC